MAQEIKIQDFIKQYKPCTGFVNGFCKKCLCGYKECQPSFCRSSKCEDIHLSTAEIGDLYLYGRLPQCIITKYQISDSILHVSPLHNLNCENITCKRLLESGEHCNEPINLKRQLESGEHCNEPINLKRLLESGEHCDEPINLKRLLESGEHCDEPINLAKLPSACPTTVSSSNEHPSMPTSINSEDKCQQQGNQISKALKFLYDAQALYSATSIFIQKDIPAIEFNPSDSADLARPLEVDLNCPPPPLPSDRLNNLEPEKEQFQQHPTNGTGDDVASDPHCIEQDHHSSDICHGAEPKQEIPPCADCELHDQKIGALISEVLSGVRVLNTIAETRDYIKRGPSDWNPVISLLVQVLQDIND